MRVGGQTLGEVNPQRWFVAGQWRQRNSQLMVLALLLGWLLGLSPTAVAQLAVAVTVEKIDGAIIKADWHGVTAGGHFQFHTKDGMLSLPRDEISAVLYRPLPQIPSNPFGQEALRLAATSSTSVTGSKSTLGNTPERGENENDLLTEDDPELHPDVKPDAVTAIFYLADGGKLPGALLRSPTGADALMTRSVLGDEVEIPYDHLAGIQLARGPNLLKAQQLFDKSLRERLPGQDTMITREMDQPKALRGRLESLGGVQGSFYFAKRSRVFQAEKMFGLVFAQGIDNFDRARFPVSVRLMDGSFFSGRITSANESMIELMTSVGAAVKISIADLATLKRVSPRLVYVSDLTPTSTKTEGLLHAPWPVKFDRNVTGGMLMMKGRAHSRGIGMHSKTTLTYSLGQRFEALAGVIGIDDAVRPRGHVVFRVLGDDRELFNSGPVTGQDEPRSIIVNVESVGILTLVVDYGEEVDLSDHADWGSLRLIKPRQASISSASY